MFSVRASEADSLTHFVCAARPHLPTLSDHMRQGKRGRGKHSGRGKCVGLWKEAELIMLSFFSTRNAMCQKEVRITLKPVTLANPDLRGVAVCGSALLLDPVERRAKAGLILCQLPVEHR